MSQKSRQRLLERYDPLLTEKIAVSIGPQHPSLAAPLRLLVQADGELIERVTVEQGYMHRGVEYLATRRPWSALGGLLSRCEWLAGMNGDYLASAAIEQICGITPPPRAQYLRTLALELSRLGSHLFWFGDLGLEVGAITPIFWALEQREGALGLLETLSGQRYHHGWILPGGVQAEPPGEFWPALTAWTDGLGKHIDEFEDFFSDNALWVNRSELVGVLEPAYALMHGASGPVLRASGVAHDLRRDAPYAAYGELAFAVPVGEYGDSLDRYRVRFLEMRESLKIVAQCVGVLVGTPPTPSGGGFSRRTEKAKTATEVAATGEIVVPSGEAHIAVEGPRGELALTVISEGGPSPARVHLRGPSLYHLHLLDELCAGHLLADLFVIYASLDIMVGEADR